MYKINHANIKDWAKNYDGELFDGILCDPPYELNFMGGGKKDWWDNTGIAFDTEMWADIYKLLKPGAHLLAFSGSRTYHRMAVAIEDAGFEIRDMIEWVYGSGFPKSLNIGKAVDKIAERNDMFKPFAEHYEAQRKAKGLTHNQICEIGRFYSNHNHGGASSNWATGANVPTLEQWKVLQPLLELSDEFTPLIERIEREREVIGNKDANEFAYSPGLEKTLEKTTLDITKGTSEWEGYGTALKPAHEPCVLARKPIDGTVANNVLKHGTGGLNIDGSRVGFDKNNKEDLHAIAQWDRQARSGVKVFNQEGTAKIQEFNQQAPLGRFPANLIHDGSDEVEAVFPNNNSRFFYSSKSSKSERNAGLEGFEDIRGGAMQANTTDKMQLGGASLKGEHKEIQPTKNGHPTVKPLSLTKYLATLIKPPTGGRLLVPFSGSGSEMIGALQAGWEYVEGVELTEEYIPIAEARIKYWLEQMGKEQISLL